MARKKVNKSKRPRKDWASCAILSQSSVVPRRWDLQGPCSTVPPPGGGGKRAGLQHMAPDTRASYGPKGYRTVLLKWSSVIVF